MKAVILLILVISLTVQPAYAAELTAPTVPEAGQQLMPERADSFGEGLWQLFQAAIGLLHPDIREAAQVCLRVIAVTLLVSLVKTFPGSAKDTADLVCTVAIGTLLLQSTQSLINLGTDTVTQMSEYGKLLLPVMTAALAAQGGITGSAALYAGTALFNSLLSSIISGLLVPMIYLYLALAAANSAMGEDILKKLRDFVRWLMTWCLKTILYVFTGYIGITGVVSGTTDAAALKAAKLTISGVVPVVGGILSDASEAVLVSAGLVKNSAGIYGMLAILAVCIGPFLKIGAQYMLLKATAAITGVFGSKRVCGLVEDFSGAMGLLLAMTGSVCLLLLISTVCFLKGVG